MPHFKSKVGYRSFFFMMRVNEIFYSLQGEGFYTGVPSVFIRLSGCNLQCSFCDTTHQSFVEMSEVEIVRQAESYPAKHVVITGGEPSLQLTESLINALHEVGKFVAVETNGTHKLPLNVDWITLSPKDAFVGTLASKVVLMQCNEIKVVYTGEPLHDYSQIHAMHHFIQPCDTGDGEKNKIVMNGAIDYCLQHPQWRLSLQTHKLIGVR